MEDLFTRILEKNFYTFKGLVAGILLFFLVIIFKLDTLLEKGIPCFEIRCFIYIALLVIWTIIWWCLREYLPRNPKGKVGLLMAIVTESEKQKIRIKNDLSEGIKKLLEQHNLSNMVKVIVLEDFKANKVAGILQEYMLKKDEIDRNYINLDKTEKEKKLKGFSGYKDFEKLRERVNCYFYMWGKIKERQDIESKYYIDLEALVVHKPLEKEAAELIKREFVAIFPKEVSFPEKFEFKGFQLTSDWIFIAAMYITGYAAFLSNDPFIAYELHKNVQNELDKFKEKFKSLPPNLQNMENNLKKKLLPFELLLQAQSAYCKGDFSKAKKFLEEAESIDNKNYEVLVTTAYLAFNIEKDDSKSLEYLKKASEVGSSDYTWLYNRAFIYMYMGDFEKGFNDYKKLSDIKFLNEPQIVDKCIEYSKNLAADEPDKYQLLFIIGYLYYSKKNDLTNALTYFESFKTKACPNADYIYLCKRVDTYIAETKNKLLSKSNGI